jgi:hypothetical protein
MPTKTRAIIVSLLILLGGVLFCYCAVFYPIEVTAQVKGDSTPAIGTEPTPVKSTSTSSIERDKTGQTNPTRSEGKSRPRTGAT